MRRMIPILLLLLVAPRSGLGEDEILEGKTARLLEGVAKDLATVGKGDESAIVRDVLLRLGRSADSLKRLEKACEKALARPRASAAKLRAARKKLVQAADRLTEALAAAEGDAKELLARQILRLDGSQRAAHEALGHLETDDGWLPKEKAAAREGRNRVKAAVAAAAGRKFPVTHGKSPFTIIEEACGRPGNRVAWQNVEVHGPFSPDRLERILLRALRAKSLSRELLTGDPAFEKLRAAKTFLLVDSVVAYDKAVAIARKSGKITAEGERGARAMTSFWLGSGNRDLITLVRAEASALSMVVYHLTDWRHVTPKRKRAAQPCLVDGHVNWLCLATLGVPMPGVSAWREVDDEKAGHGTAALSEAERKRRDRIFRMANAGLVGCRSWMAYLAERREDPPWSDSFKGAEGEVRGLPLLKATLVVEYLQELGRFSTLVEATAQADTGGAVPHDAAIFEGALGTPLLKFEEAWRAWIVGSTPSVLERFDGVGDTGPSETESSVRTALESIRRAALEPRVMEEHVAVQVLSDLSAGARAHALYLAQNLDQLAKWPDAHEEWPDRPGYSIEGSMAGMASVIDPDARTPEDALRSWMGTFYHRLPLLAAGLRAIGWGHEKGIAVLDAASVVEPWESKGRFVLWPHQDMANVPRRFNPELPSPVPGENQNQWGYPITIQGGVWDQTFEMTLYEGKAAPGNEVPCHLSTPWKPTNPELAPDGAACLIPKSHLKANTTYTVVAKNLPEGGRLTWTFRTGR